MFAFSKMEWHYYKLMCIPFTLLAGKDVPTLSSEFAHPDVVIGLTLWAYRLEGLRRSDMDALVRRLLTDMQV